MTKKKFRFKGLVVITFCVVAISFLGFGGAYSNQNTGNGKNTYELVDTNFSDEKKDGLVETSYDLYISNSPNKDPEHYTEAKPGETLKVQFDDSKTDFKNYSAMYTKQGIKSDEVIQKELDILNELKDREVEVYIIYSKQKAIRTSYPEAYERVYKGKLKDLNINYEIKNPEFTEKQVSKMTEDALEKRKDECEFNIVFRFDEEFLNNHLNEALIIPLKSE